MGHDFDRANTASGSHRWHRKRAGHDLFLIATAFVILLWAAYEFTIFGSWSGVPSEKRIDFYEAVLLGVFLCVSLWVFSWRRLEDLRREAAERVRAEQRAAEAELRAQLDPLTGLANRAKFDMSLSALVGRAGEGQASNSTAAILLLDLNRFKQVNDRFGHPMGDAVLKAVSRRLQAGMRERDAVFRLGGDEFAIIAYEIEGTSPHERHDAVRSIAEKVIRIVDRPVSVDGRTVEVGVSIGISFYPQSGRTVRELVRKADVALYAAKEDGKATGKSAYRVCSDISGASLRSA